MEAYADRNINAPKAVRQDGLKCCLERMMEKCGTLNSLNGRLAYAVDELAGRRIEAKSAGPQNLETTPPEATLFLARHVEKLLDEQIGRLSDSAERIETTIG